MNEILKEILYIIITLVGSVLSTYLCALAKKKISEIAQNMSNTKLSEYIKVASGVVIDAVDTVAQTYVNTLKKEGQFNEEAQKIAKEQAITIATQLISVDGKKAIETVYGDFAQWLNTKIESEVLAKKG